MVIVPQQGPTDVRIAAIERRITACRSSATVLGCCSKQAFAVNALRREIEQLEVELAELKAPQTRSA